MNSLTKIASKRIFNLFIVLLLGVVIGFVIRPATWQFWGWSKDQFYEVIASDFNELWPRGFEVVEIPSSIDGKKQRAFVFDAKRSESSPLIVSLHQWGGDYAERDRMAIFAKQAGIYYIHPNFRGKNISPESCASPKALSDIDDAIDYCIRHWNVDQEKVVVIGKSGGGHAACALFCKTKHKIRAFYVWSPVVDILKWYHQCRQRGLNYAADIESVCGGSFKSEIAVQRSPVHMRCENIDSVLHLFAGINDGYTGGATQSDTRSIPAVHAAEMYNMVCDKTGFSEDKVPLSQLLDIATKALPPTDKKIQNRTVYFNKVSTFASLTVFDGGHEILSDYCFNRIQEDLQDVESR